jgi:hypothetical protein
MGLIVEPSPWERPPFPPHLLAGQWIRPLKDRTDRMRKQEEYDLCPVSRSNRSELVAFSSVSVCAFPH